MPASTPWWSTPSTAAPRPGRRPTLGPAAAIVSLVLSGAAMADPPPTLARQESHRIGNQSIGGYAMHGAPYGLDRGTCDRTQLSRDMAKDLRQADLKMARTAPAESSNKPDGKGVLVTAAAGRSMDATDQACISRILEYAPDRTAIRWYGAAHGAYGGPAYAVTPLRTFERDGLYCREFQTVGTINGETEQSYVTACRMPDSVWRPVS